MNGIGYVPVNLIEPDVTGFVNVAKFSDKGIQLDGSNLMECITRAHEAGYSSYFIPSGYYLNPKCDINWDCRITCDKEAIFEIDEQSADFKYIFRFTFCSIELNGGTYKSGTFVFDHNDGTDDIGTVGRTFLFPASNPSPTSTHVQSTLILYLACHDCKTSNIYSPYNNIGGGINQRNCRNMVVTNCKFLNYLEQAVTATQTRYAEDISGAYSPKYYNNCYSFEVSNCVFKNAMLANQSYNGRDSSGNPQPHQWCYGTATGVAGNPKSLTSELDTWKKVCDASIKPIENLIYRNNYMDGSEDCGLDTHGARNVIIENNTVLNTVCAITAYNDNNREPRPTNWRMENILIQNNYCKSPKKVPEGTNYPHPFVFLGPSCTGALQPADWSAEMTLTMYSNCIVRNNYFETASNIHGDDEGTGRKGWLELNQGGSQLIVENNLFASMYRSDGTWNRWLATVYNWEKVTFINNRNVGTYRLYMKVMLSGIKFENNNSIDLADYYDNSYIECNDNLLRAYQSRLAKNTIMKQAADGTLVIPTGNFGLRYFNIQKQQDNTYLSYSYKYSKQVYISGNTLTSKYLDDQGNEVYHELGCFWMDTAIQILDENNSVVMSTYLKNKVSNTTFKLNNSVTTAGYYYIRLRPTVAKVVDTWENIPTSASNPPA